jgi:diketogulonate reductase-like aldo/keto reductase
MSSVSPAARVHHPDVRTEYHFEKNLEVIEHLKDIAARKGVSLPRLALAWVLSNPTVSVGVVGARNVHEIEDNVEAVEITLDRDDLAEIDQIMTARPDRSIFYLSDLAGRHGTCSLYAALLRCTATAAQCSDGSSHRKPAPQ